MAREHNFLLGRGEALAYRVKIRKASKDKNPPYSFGEAQERLEGRLARANEIFAALPEDACPRQQVVGILTLHPRYLAKSDFPERLFDVSGIRPIGSRLRTIEPTKWGIKKPPSTGKGLAEDIFVAGTRRAFSNWGTAISTWTEQDDFAPAIQRIEDFSAFRAESKIKHLPHDREQHLYEVVLHNSEDERIVEAFFRFAERLGALPLPDKRKDAKGLTFVPVRGRTGVIMELSEFAFVRVARTMPRLRPLRPNITRLVSASSVVLPERPPLDLRSRAAVFDGGIPSTVDLSRWVNVVTPPGIGEPKPEHEAHGLAVTSALLFGSLEDGEPLADPLCTIDHIRVLDKAATGSDLEYTDVLGRITTHLDAHIGEYQFVNISLGPQMAVDDDEVTQWTACLDERFAHAGMLATVAAGNDGELDAALGLNRIQPPADGVNVLSVGACDSSVAPWQRAGYSCVGPGRTPGIVKPDGLMFGGSDAEPFKFLSPNLKIHGSMGTSLAAPLALRSAIAVRAQLGERLSPLTIRALMIHRAEDDLPDEDDPIRHEYGWGRFLSDYDQLITCDDDEALVIYQGTLPVGEYLRAPIPLPEEPLRGEIHLSATLVIAPEIDPEHAGAYTRSGVLVTFRPDERNFAKNRPPVHPKSESFFSLRNMYAAAEFQLRKDGQKWEPCIRARRKKRSDKLYKPVFDIQYQHREGLEAARAPKPIPFALVVGMKAPKVADLYNRVVRAYSNYLIALEPRLRIRHRV